MKLASYQPVWPETSTFWGAGATSTLKLKTTAQLGTTFFHLAEKNKNLKQRVENAIGASNKRKQALIDLLMILGDPETINSSEPETAMKRQFKNLTDEKHNNRFNELRESYDWESLYYLIQTCSGKDSGSFQLQDLFNIIDMHILNKQGFYVNHEKLIPPEKLIPARNALKMLTVFIHSTDFYEKNENDKHVLAQYKSFGEILRELMTEEGLRFYSEGKKTTEREFYLFSHSFISMNWDPVLLWILFQVHKQYNHSLSIPHIGSPPAPMKLFHDMGHFMGVRKIDGETPQVWYPFNETVVQRVNDPEHVQSRIVRVGKYYFPHGCTGWRECPNCGKLTFYLGSDWDDMPNFFPPQILPGLQFGFVPRSLEEKDAFEKGIADAIQCSFCGTITESKHIPLIMQSSFKGEHPSFIEEIQRDMRVSLEKAKHIVLMGYSLPSDDVIYRSLLAARKNRSERPILCSIVGYVDGAPDRWMEKEELKSFVNQLKKASPGARMIETVESVTNIFGEENVRAYAAGIPSVFLDPHTNKASKKKVMNLLYPQTVSGFGNHLVKR